MDSVNPKTIQNALGENDTFGSLEGYNSLCNSIISPGFLNRKIKDKLL